VGGSLALLGAALVPTAATAAPAAAQSAAPAAVRADRMHLQHTSFRGADLRSGDLRGLRMRKGSLVLADEPRRRRFAGRTYDMGVWSSPWVEPGFALTELIPSWQATTRRDSWVEVRVRGRAADGRRSSWDVMARWTTSEKWLRRTTLHSQADDLANVNVDTWRAPGGLTSWQVQVKVMERQGTRARAVLRRVGAVASRLPDRTGVATSTPTSAVGTTLKVPTYSQMIHRGHSPQWGGGGVAWCSPTSTSMVLAYHDSLPRARSWAWVGSDHPDPWVDHTARMVYDHGYDGAGNWAFNTAFAGSLVREAYVTRLRSLRQAERFIADGVPLIVSVRFGRGELDNAPISSTNGHLMVIVGFTKAGDVVVNDPAAAGNGGVRRTYDRGQFEDVWLPTSGGLAYVIRP
jgi:hypothetical protein